MEGILATTVFRMSRKREKVIFSSGKAGLLCGDITPKVAFPRSPAFFFFFYEKDNWTSNKYMVD